MSKEWHSCRQLGTLLNGDALWLEQVFVNLLSNAIKFGPSNSTITVSIDCLNEDVVIPIADRGPGIPAKDIRLIFDRFQPTAKVSGTGLGLSIAKELIELHHGAISVESEDSKGSIFSVSLPLRMEADARQFGQQLTQTCPTRIQA
jgi:signal transduction histidine kinase